MYIKCWGSRGSIPVSGKEYLKYGGDTTCLEIRTLSDDIIIVDAGTGIRRLGNRLIEEQRFGYHMLLTHAHWDHLIGFPFFKPILYKNAELRMHCGPFSTDYVQKMLSRIMSPPNFPLKYSAIQARILYEASTPRDFDIGSMRVVPFPLSHPNGGTGFKFIEEGRTFVFLTDNELGFVHPHGRSFEAYSQFSTAADLLIQDGEYTPEEYTSRRGWGHSVYTDALKLGVQAGVRRLGLFHLNQERTDEQMDGIVAECRRIMATDGHDGTNGMDCFAVGTDMTFEL
jgi:phosphoribosyl 1,2-cyclic phosphodiesterase